MGEMKGEMKIAKPLYLKGSAPSDGRDGPFFTDSQPKSGNVTQGRNAQLSLGKVAIILRISECFPKDFCNDSTR